MNISRPFLRFREICQRLKRPLFILFFSSACLAGCLQESAKPLHIATNILPGYEPIYLAHTLGYLSDTSAILHEMSNSSDVIKAFRNCEIHVAALTLDETLLLLQEGIDARFQNSLKGLIMPDQGESLRLRAGTICPPARRLPDVMLHAKLQQKPVNPARLLRAQP